MGGRGWLGVAAGWGGVLLPPWRRSLASQPASQPSPVLRKETHLTAVSCPAPPCLLPAPPPPCSDAMAGGGQGGANRIQLAQPSAFHDWFKVRGGGAPACPAGWLPGPLPGWQDRILCLPSSLGSVFIPGRKRHAVTLGPRIIKHTRHTSACRCPPACVPTTPAPCPPCPPCPSLPQALDEEYLKPLFGGRQGSERGRSPSAQEAGGYAGIQMQQPPPAGGGGE